MRYSAQILLISIFLAGLPSLPGAQLSEPEKNFEALWKTFHERYAFFKLRGVDWQEQYRAFRPQVTKVTTDEELFKILCDMLKPLKDGHVNLKAKGLKGGRFNPEETPRFFREFNTRKLEKSYEVMVRKTLAGKGFGEQKKATDLLVYSRNKDFGYLLITEFEGVKRRKLETALDKVLGELAGVKGLIIDIRLNPGGTDQCVYQIASRFADKKRIGHYRKTKRGPGEDDFNELKTRYLKPAEDAGSNGTFTGPIALLTHDASFSAADAFAMLMADLPHVTIIGEPTNGIFSNMLERKLPNGWKYSLSFQVYYSAAMICHESKGIPVDIRVLNMRGDLEKGIDPLIIKSLEVMAAK
ncbi:MAG: S41 family peptidase [Verrucomicrobiales bacterium]